MYIIKVLNTSVLLMVLCCLIVAGEKKIELEDIELDNLKSERDKEGGENTKEDDYLQPPSINAEQSANYGPPDNVNYNKNQYAVEEASQAEAPIVVYPSNNGDYHSTGQRYVEIKRGQEAAQKPESYDAAYGQQTHNTLDPNAVQQSLIANYIPGMTMQLVYVPQYDPSASNQITMYAQQYQTKQPMYYYQPTQQTGITYANEEQKYQTNTQQANQEAQQIDSDPNQQYTQYVTIPAQGNQVYAIAQSPNYVLSPQSQDAQLNAEKINKSPSLQQNYAGFVQQYAYTNTLPQSQPHSAPEYKYVTPATPLQSIVPQYQTAQDQANPSISLYSAPSGQAGHIPRILPQYAQAVSHPVYAHISGNLVHDSQKQSYESNSLVQEQYKQPHHVGRNQPNQFKSVYNYYSHGKPNSLLDSYIPSSLQVEYLKRGLSKEPLSTYDTIAFSRNAPKQFERGFLPNQMYPTGSGGVTFGQFKRSTKQDA